MPKFDKLHPVAPASPVTTIAPARTYEGGEGFTRDAKGELFLLAVVNMVGEDTFYEAAADRDERFRRLVHAVALDDPAWVARFVPYLRDTLNLRSVSLVMAAEYARALLTGPRPVDAPSPRSVIASALRRADEPAELLAYWTARYGRRVPMAVKRGVADAVRRLWTERAALKYDGGSRNWRMADVLELTHPKPSGPAQSDLFAWLLDRRHHGDDVRAPLDRLPMVAANRRLHAVPTGERRALLDQPERLAEAGMTWESLSGWLGGPMDAGAWTAMLPSMGYMACLAAGTPVWLADGTAAPIEEVVAKRLPVLSYDKPWDARPVKYGANQRPRDHSVGELVPTVPSAWLNTGVRPVAAVRLVSGRTIAATYDHRWIRQRRGGRQAWEWTTTADLRVGDRIPAPLTADYFGDEGDAWDGYFVGAMLGDGGMTSVTPEFHGDPDDGVVEFMREYATKLGCGVTEYPNGRIVRMRFPFKQWKRNPVAEVLRSYDVWGKRSEVKGLPGRSFSREFWIGVLSGLIDTDGHVRERVNPRGTVHGSVEYATVSRRLADQVSDALLLLGVTNIVRTRPVSLRTSIAGGHRVQSRHPIHIVEVNRAISVVRLAGLLNLRIGYKAAMLNRLTSKLRHVQAARSEMHGYDERVALDRVVSVDDAGEAPTYCVTVDTSNLFVANGVVTGNCLRNLRNLDEAGVPDEDAKVVAERLADPAEVARSRQMPFRFLSAYKAAPGERWSLALERALDHAVANVPALPGRTLVLVDTSASMMAPVSRRSTVTALQAGALFGAVLAVRSAGAELAGYADGSFTFPVPKAAGVLKTVTRFEATVGSVGYGTETARALRERYAGHDRVVVITDGQAFWDGRPVGSALPDGVPLYTFNTVGYRTTHAPAGGRDRHELGGLTDAAFTTIAALEAKRTAGWPF